MKRYLLWLSGIAALFIAATSCYDDSELVERVNNAEQKIESLEELYNTLSTNVSSLQTIVEAMQKGITIEKIDETENGYTIYFSDGKTVQINNAFGQPVPQIGVKEYEGRYYWTFNGEWLTDDNGEKILAEAAVPEFKIEDDFWYVSYDDGVNWIQLGTSTGDSFFEEVRDDDENVYFVLKDGTTITIAKSKNQPALYLKLDTEELIQMTAGQTVEIGYEIVASENAETSLQTFEQYGWAVEINPDSENSNTGTISITASSPIRDGKILFILSDNKGNYYIHTVEIKGNGNVIEIVKDSYTVDDIGGMLDINVNSNIEFTVSIPENAKSWIETVFIGQTTRFSIKANETYDDRTAAITFIGNDGETRKEITITQLQKDAILLTSPVFDLSAEEQPVTLIFTSNVNVKVNIPETVSWISEVTTKAMTEHTINLQIQANDSPEQRTAQITLSAEDSSISQPVRINQAGYQADYIVFEDPLFNESLVELYDTNEDKAIDSREASAITNIVCSNRSIYSLKGIDRLTNLQTLDCSNNSITELDLTANKELTSVKCHVNSLVDLNIEGLEKLTYLDCNSNSLTEINTFTNPELSYYNCSSNNIKALDVSKNTKLDKLYCHSCRLLTTLNIENVSNLTALYLNSTSENCIAQKTVNISGSSLQTLLMGGNARWTNVSVTDNPNLKSLNLDGLATMTNLTCTSNPQLSEMTVNNCYALKELECTSNILTTLDLSTNRAINNLDCSDNRLQSLNLSNNVALLNLDCSNNNLSSLSVNNSLSIDQIDCSANALSALEVTSLSELNDFNCSDNEIKSLDLSNNVKLAALNCSGNPLTGLDLSNNKTIETIDCSTTDIISFDLTANTSLSGILCKDCYSLSSVLFPETLETIQQEAFMNCTSLTSLTLPASVTSLGQDAFRNCTQLSELNINSDIVGEEFYESYFTGDPVSTVIMNENVITIGESAFVGAQIGSITIPASVTTIGSSAFAKSLTLTSVSFAPNSNLQTINDYAFNSCKNLKTFDASNCNNIKRVESFAFISDAINEFKIGTTAPPSAPADNHTDITNLYVPQGCVDAYKASDWGRFDANILELE